MLPRTEPFHRQGSYRSQIGSSSGRHNGSGQWTPSSQASTTSSRAPSSRTCEPTQWQNGQHRFDSPTPPFNNLNGVWSPQPPFDEREKVKIAIICALPKEADEVLAVFDRPRDGRRWFQKTARDKLACTIRFVRSHPVVVVHMPGAGKINAARVAEHLSTSFCNIQLALLVGICGGVPGGPDGSGDVRLGDVIISQSIIPYDDGKQYPGAFERKPSATSTSWEVRTALTQLEIGEYRELLQNRLNDLLRDLQVRHRRVAYPGIGLDRLFEPPYLHKHRDTSCKTCNALSDSVACSEARSSPCSRLGCEDWRLVRRPPRFLFPDGKEAPSIHIGTIGSGDLVMKSGIHRDAIAQKEGIIAFEMEGAGLIDHKFPCLVIKGVADYADSHKNDVWHHYAAAAAACCARAFLESFWTEQPMEYPGHGFDQWPFHGSPESTMASHASELPSSEDRTHQSAVWCVPLRRKPGFSGRINELAALGSMFNNPDCSSISLYGLGGVGKTNLALEFAWSLRAKSPDVSIFWVHASDAINFENGYAEIARHLEISSMAELQTDLKHLVKQRLSQENFGPWLLIIDNVDDFGRFFGDKATDASNRLYSFVPQSSQGCTLITTRSKKVALKFSRSYHVEIPCLDQEGALTLLETLLEPLPSALDRTLACSLMDRLDHLPLAIAQATAYINLNRIDVSDYVALLDDKEEMVFELLDEDFEDEVLAPEAKRSIISTWRITFESIARHSPLAQEYLAIIACIDSKIIPERLLPQGGSPKHKIDALGLLAGYSFLTRRDSDSGSSKTYDMHSLVHLACRSWLQDKSALQTWAPRALIHMLETFPKPEHTNRSAWSLYLPHASRILRSPHIADMENRFELEYLVGQCLFLEGKYRDATDKFRIVVGHWEKILEPFHHALLQAYIRLSVALERWSQLKESLEYGQKALRGYTSTLPADDPLILSAFANIASLWRRQHNWEDALQYDQKIMIARQRVLGDNHPDTLSSMADLASSYKSMGSHEKAEELLHRVVEGQRLALGGDDPVFLTSLARLASIYRCLGKLAEAEKLGLDVLERRKRILGLYHPETLRSMANLGSTWRQQKRWQDAERIESEVLKLRTSILGSEDPHTLTAMGNLAATYRSQGKYDKAEEQDRNRLEIQKRRLGLYDPSTLSTLCSIASTYRKSNRRAEADKISKEVLDHCRHALGEKHPQTLAYMAEVAYIHKREGNIKEATSLARQVLAERERKMGPQNKLVREMRHFLSTLHRQRYQQRERREYPTRRANISEPILLQRQGAITRHDLVKETSTTILNVPGRRSGVLRTRTLQSK
ncbi:uncharacterized protein Z520_09077 [Fonsecaea multimorphosa CBS 102226]|uniref:Nucleoside phosphorylase domain-containing protein n=1 Tax=Fonsecaea multimorphosa CBS 102226 TaxID=1442371 RepID=A0A0D2IDF0_9EURO|nr:uncharacterized protein Z520_09077 [Fonsecaea multimorphosa CBS 102226]KIX95161.1 hypothetical protein Z520_09077 [Fonsecaea multimorphosa CBS 102226]